MSTDSSLCQQNGQKLYQRGDFKGAVDAFTEALKGSTDSVTVLDSRAATYAKLAQYDLALRDARHMIKKDKNDERGYLRCAKTLLLDGMLDKALEVYAYALKSLSSSHPRRQLVEQLHNKLRDKLSAKCIDPFTVLPIEVASMVLQHFDFRQTVAILRVSKKWDQFLSSRRDLWMHLDLSRARGKVNWTSVRACIRRSKSMLTGATVANLATPSVAKALQLLSRCPNLEFFELRTPFDFDTFYSLFKDSKRLKTLRTSADLTIPLRYVFEFLMALPLLERVEIHGAVPSNLDMLAKGWPEKLPNLKYISIGSGFELPEAYGFLQLTPPYPKPGSPFHNLEELRLFAPAFPGARLFLDYRTPFPRLKRLDFGGSALAQVMIPKTLEYLRIHGGKDNIHTALPVLAEVDAYLPRLTSLILSDVPWATLTALDQLLGAPEVPLRVLHVDLCVKLSGPVLVDYAKTTKLDSLVEFNVSHLREINDNVISEFMDRMTELKVLHMSHTRITGITIKRLADARASEDSDVIKIDRVYVKGCEEVSSDAVAYGRARGIELLT